MDKIYVTYDELHKDCVSLSKQLLNIPNIKDYQLVCVSRGGLFIGGILSYILDIKEVYTVCIESYNDNNDKKELVLKTPFLPNINKKKPCLIVDDIYDTGETFDFICELCHKKSIDFRFATVYNKNYGGLGFYGKILPPNQWVVFPWD